MSLECIVLEERNNALLNRREVKTILKNSAGKIKRSEAADIVAKKLNLDRNLTIPIKMRGETGKSDIYAVMYVYNNEEEAKSHLPRFRMLRNMSKEDRKKLLDEEKANKLKAKQATAAETKSRTRGGRK